MNTRSSLMRQMKPFIKNDTFLLTYGDGLANVNLDHILDFHNNHGKMATVTAVHPAARFGEIEIQEGRVLSFQEKPQTGQGWINGGFFVLEPEFFELIEGDSTILEKTPLERVTKMKELMTYQHDGFWQCMDTVRDRNVLEELWKSGQAPWKVW